MPRHIDNVESKLGGSGGRGMGRWLEKGGQVVEGLVETTTVPSEDFVPFLADVEGRIPTTGNRLEEIHTLKIHGFFSQGPRTALLYQCSQQPTDLRNVLFKVQKPSGDDRRALSRIIATQVRSLHVHFQLLHPGLRTKSFVFFGDAEKPDLTRPYVLNWVRPPSTDIYRHPEYQANKPRWFHQAWSLMMVLSEIAEWRPLNMPDGSLCPRIAVHPRQHRLDLHIITPCTLRHGRIRRL